jgi:energy-converting hydrogenase Eha subunit E
MAVRERKFSRTTIALFWLLLVGILIGFLIYWEQIALLYVFATLGLVTLLLIVSFADLEKVGRENAEVFSGEEK